MIQTDEDGKSVTQKVRLISLITITFLVAKDKKTFEGRCLSPKFSFELFVNVLLCRLND